MKITVMTVALLLAFIASGFAWNLAPDGSYVSGSSFEITPNGTYVGKD